METQKKIAGQRQRRHVSRPQAHRAARRTRPRLCVFRSHKHISAQIIDDLAGKTLAGRVVARQAAVAAS